MTKYRGKTIIGLAQTRGSAAKTQAGAWKYLLANLPKPIRTRNTSKYDWEQWTRICLARTGDGRAKILGYDLDDPNTPGRILDRAYEDNRQWDVRRALAVYRDNYGAIHTCQAAPLSKPITAYWEAVDMLGNRAHAGIIPAAYNSIAFDLKGRAEGSAVHRELYDYTPNALIVCVRETEGTRYGVKTLSKTYYLLTWAEDGTETAGKLTIPVAKYAKMQGIHAGDIIAVARGDKKITLLNSTHRIHRGYKAAKITDDGGFVSVWDGSPWVLGQTRIEKAHDDHDGGLYYYSTLAALAEAISTNGVFGDAHNHHHLAVLEVEASGNQIDYGGKIAATRITPIRHIACTL